MAKSQMQSQKDKKIIENEKGPINYIKILLLLL